MALNKVQLRASIKAAFIEAKSKDKNPEAAFDALAAKIADAIDSYVRQMQITYTTGLTAPNGPVGGLFGNTIN